MTIRDRLKETAVNAPDTPGVYIFRDIARKPVYIGKAKSLKKRVISYFKEENTKNTQIIKLARDLDFLTLKTESEALILEADLIKFHRPKYNVLLKDDKRFPYIRIDLSEKWPYPEVVRYVKKDGAKYFGPYLKPNSLRNTLFLSRKYFKFRSCTGVLPKKECLDYHIGLCSAPCAEKISRAEYRESILAFVDFLSGGVQKMVRSFQIQMEELSEKMEYEKAAEKRDAITHMRNIMFGERKIFNDGRNRDIVGFAKRGRRGCFFIMQIREGRLHEAFPVMTELPTEISEEEAFSRFIVDFYRSRQPPEIILSQTRVNDKNLIEEWMKDSHGTKSVIRNPRNAFERDKLDEISKIALSKLLPVKRGVPPLLRDFALALKLDEPPQTIYCFDISHTKFREIKGSQICFKNARPYKKMYRQYDIPDGFDDLAAMNFVVKKFSQHVASGDLEKPDLVVLDGGPEQLKAALRGMRESRLEIDAISIAKRYETIHFENGETLSLPGFSPVLFLLKRIRDESHRFGVTSHRKKRTKNLFKSSFLEIPGVGEKIARELRKKFKKIQDIKNCPVEEVAEIDLIGEKKARYIVDFVKKKY
ncbi:excinuclease ABC subunit UvrC [candidate division WOR-3 bacterium]|nr:excinuclease ABC subunit UvrC [candidate division WOR-3 bacterium]